MPLQSRGVEDTADTRGERVWLDATRVRPVFWALLAGVLLFSLAVPVQHVWQAASSELHLRACVWPASPRVGETTRLFVVPRSDDDHRAIAGPWTTFVVTRGMERMAMDTQPVVRDGQVTDRPALALPIGLEMAGKWWIWLVVHPRGRPTWQTRVPLTVLPEAASSPTGPQAPPTAEGCHIQNGSQQL